MNARFLRTNSPKENKIMTLLDKGKINKVKLKQKYLRILHLSCEDTEVSKEKTDCRAPDI